MRTAGQASRPRLSPPVSIRGAALKKEANVLKRTKKLVVTAMMVAIMEILIWTPIGMIIIPPISATTAHIPVIVCAILEGPVAGALVGLAFGATSMLRAATSPNFLDILFLNPLVGMLPRMLIGITSYYSFVLLKKVLGGLFAKGNAAASFLAGCVGSMTNTLGCMGMIYLLYARDVTENMGISADKFVTGVIVTYGTPEMLVAGVMVAAVATVVLNTFYKNEDRN